MKSMPILEESQQHYPTFTLQDIGEMILELNRQFDAQDKAFFTATFEQQSLIEEAPDSLDARSTPQQMLHTRPPDVQPNTRRVSMSRWQPPPSQTVEDTTTTDSTPLFRIEAPRFNGHDPVGWIFGIQEYFNYFLTSESIRLAVVEKLIEQPASDWFRCYQQNNDEGSWMDFLAAVYRRFAPELTEGEVTQVVDENQLDVQPLNMESSVIVANEIGLDTRICDESFTTNSKDVDNVGDIVASIAFDSRQPMEDINGVDSFF